VVRARIALRSSSSAARMADEDWEPGDELRGETFTFAAWTPPPPEWVAVCRDDAGRITSVSMRCDPGLPGWAAGDYPVWDHDHCEICWQRLTHNPDYEDGQQTGWRTGHGWGSYCWVCAGCFADLRERFGWKVGPAS
jgi:hypothetical protein